MSDYDDTAQFYQTPQIKDWEGMSREEKQEIYDLAKRSKPFSQLSDQEKKDIMDLTIDTGYRPPPFRGKVKKKMDNSELSGENIEKANELEAYEAEMKKLEWYPDKEGEGFFAKDGKGEYYWAPATEDGKPNYEEASTGTEFDEELERDTPKLYAEAKCRATKTKKHKPSRKQKGKEMPLMGGIRKDPPHYGML